MSKLSSKKAPSKEGASLLFHAHALGQGDHAAAQHRDDDGAQFCDLAIGIVDPNAQGEGLPHLGIGAEEVHILNAAVRVVGREDQSIHGRGAQIRHTHLRPEAADGDTLGRLIVAAQQGDAVDLVFFASALAPPPSRRHHSWDSKRYLLRHQSNRLQWSERFLQIECSSGHCSQRR